MTAPTAAAPGPQPAERHWALIMGACPLLVATDSLLKGVGLGAATLVALATTTALMAVGRRFIPASARLASGLLILAALLSLAQILSKAFFFDLHLELRILLPLVMANCAIIGCAQAVATARAAREALALGLGFAVLLTAFGAFREIAGQGTVLSWPLPGTRGGFALAAAPAGAFFALALLIGVSNAVVSRRRADDHGAI